MFKSELASTSNEPTFTALSEFISANTALFIILTFDEPAAETPPPAATPAFAVKSKSSEALTFNAPLVEIVFPLLFI